MSIVFAALSFGEALVRELKKLLPGQANLSESIREAIDFGPRFHLHVGSWSIPISDAVISMWLAIAVLAVFGYIFGARPQLKPNKRQTAAEALVGAIWNLCRDSGLNEAQTRTVVPFVGSLGLFIVIANIISLFGLKPASQNIGFPAALAILTIVVVIVLGLRFVGLRGFWHSISRPIGAMVPFKILDYFIKPLSLAFRLFGNVFGAFVLLEFVRLVIPLALPGLIGLWFDLGDGIIQAVVFSYLTIIYIGEIVEGGDEEEAPQLAAQAAATPK